MTYLNVANFIGVKDTDLVPIWDKLAEPLDEGKITNMQFIEEVLEKLGKKVDVDKLLDIYLKSYQPKKDVQKYVKTLKNKFELAMLTNFGEAFHSCQKRWGLNKIFDKNKIFLSADLQMIKPKEEIFKYVLNQLKCKPDETVFVDDRPVNVMAAKRLGLKTVLFVNLETLKEDLEKILNSSNAR